MILIRKPFSRRSSILARATFAVLSRNKTTAPKAVYLQCADQCAEFKEEMTELKPHLLRFQINATAISELHPQYGFQLMFS